MQRPDIELGERGYVASHVKQVSIAMETNFSGYFDSFWINASAVQAAFKATRDDWERDQKAYETLLDSEFLEEFEDDPNAFKSALRKGCPIIRRCLNANTDEMKDYKMKFNIVAGDELLTVTRNLVDFSDEYMETFGEEWLETVSEVADLELNDLQTEDYTAYGVIGGGIKSHFLYSLHPQTFPNRSQNAIWALYFLSGKSDFGFSDGSEFLMMHTSPKGAIIQQNYHYPYDLFSFYALNVYRWLEKECRVKRVELDSDFRFIYLEAFFDHVADKHREDIRIFKGKGTGEYEHGG